MNAVPPIPDTPRLDYIRRRLTDDPICEVQVIPANGWAPASDDPHARFGWRFDSSDLVLVCPELIAEQTGQLDHDSLDYYLSALNIHISMHITHPNDDEQQVSELADSMVYDSAPAGLRVVSDVQLHILDTTSTG